MYFLQPTAFCPLVHFVVITEAVERWPFTLDAIFLLYEFHDVFRALRRDHEVVHVSANVLLVGFVLG